MSLKVKIEFELEGDASETEAIKECVHQYLVDAIDADELEFEVVEDEEEEF